MFYLGIDQHGMQLTIDLGDEAGDLVMHLQVKTEPKALTKFLMELQKLAAPHGGYLAVVEVCGFNDYLLALLKQHGCIQAIVVQPEKRDKKKTDRRDARHLRETLWVNRLRILKRQRVSGLRIVRPANAQDNASRQLTMLRTRMIRLRTSAINKVRGILRKSNLQHFCPTKGIQTKRAVAWLRQLELGDIDRLEMDIHLDRWKLYNDKLQLVNARIKEIQRQHDNAAILITIPGLSDYGSLAIGSRIGAHEDFPRAASLACFWGLTPGSNSSGNKIRNGQITKEGSPLVRHILAQAVLHVLRKDAWMRSWYQKIKRRRGSNIARVAVMRRLATIIWSMLKYKVPYVVGGPEELRKVIKSQQILSQEATVVSSI
ncbi:MAG: IS110 family transposase [Blastopirellula sp.]|nr:MAG: IS110 family transposase [Blastopirellula sp.]